MNYLHPKNINIGDTFYECEYNITVEATATTQPIFDAKDRAWHWDATTKDGKLIKYIYSDLYTNYSPRLYSANIYV